LPLGAGITVAAFGCAVVALVQLRSRAVVELDDDPSREAKRAVQAGELKSIQREEEAHDSIA
ncbi:MAG TPA: hypothetical protein VHL54_12630, partial [Actinomycetota bacterium]|nr:hypothetical protein [Actinomycetota bacterium]